MDFVFVLAQQEPGKPANYVKVGDWLFEKYPPIVAIPVFIAGVVVVGLVIERLIVAVVHRLTARARTPVNVALLTGLPSVLRPAFVLAALHLVVNVVLRVERQGTEHLTDTHLTDTGRWVSTLLIVLTILVLAFCVVRLTMKMIDAWAAADESRRPIGPPMKFGIKVIATPLAVLVAAEVGGVQITSIVAAASIGSLAVGLAMQDTLKNIIAGIQIVLDRPIRAGDYVEVDKNVRGTVLEIGLRSTKLRSPDSNTIIIPNGTIANAIVTNFDYADRSYIQTFQISVAYGSDTRRVQKVLDEVAAAAAKELDGVVADLPCAALTALAESGIDFTVSVKLRQWAGRQPIVTELHHRFYDRLRAEGIEIPFPTRTLFIRNETATSAAPAPSSPPAPSTPLSR